MGGHTAWRDLAKRTRDRILWNTPGLQALVRAGARRGYVPAVAWRRLHPYGIWRMHAPDGTPFLYDSAYVRDGIARHIVWTDMRHWEITTQPVLYELARKAAVFVDVGAYSGIYTIMACTANPQLRAVAVEPNPDKLPQIRSNVAINCLQDRVTVIGAALSDNSGKATLSIPADDSTASLDGARSAVRAAEVAVTTGDLALGGLHVDLMKIDVEGFEAEVLTGMPRTLDACHPKIIAECLTQEALQRLHRVTSDAGYRHAYHLMRDRLVPVGDRPFHPANYLFTVEPMTGRT